MPFITDTAMQKVATKLQSFETREEKRKVEVRQKLNEAKTVAESSLGAALVGLAPTGPLTGINKCDGHHDRSRCAHTLVPEGQGRRTQPHRGQQCEAQRPSVTEIASFTAVAAMSTVQMHNLRRLRRDIGDALHLPADTACGRKTD